MKKIYLVGLAFALLTASCDDVLEKTSSTQLPMFHNCSRSDLLSCPFSFKLKCQRTTWRVLGVRMRGFSSPPKR